jgi:NAD(P)-dependent dehydrogenase (short-subunit alcohol dehydrogenase family)
MVQQQTDAGSRMRFKDKVAFITGAGTGIGRATAIAFASEGAR